MAEFEKVRYVNEFAKIILKILIRDQDTLDMSTSYHHQHKSKTFKNNSYLVILRLHF